MSLGVCLLAAAGCGGARSVVDHPNAAHPSILQKGKSPLNWVTLTPPLVGQYPDAVIGPDKNMWFTDSGEFRIVRVTMTGAVKEFAPAITAGYIAVGADNKFYYTDGSDAFVGTMTVKGVTNRFATPSGDAPSGITRGPDGNVWFIEDAHVGKIQKTGKITEYPLPSGGGSGGGAITIGPDGNLWFTEHAKAKVGTVTTSGVVTEYSVQSAPSCSPTGIVAGPDGNLWFVCSPFIGRLTTTGSVFYIAIPGSPSASFLMDMTIGPDGDPWFCANTSTSIYEVDPATSTVTTYTPPNTGFGEETIELGPDKNVWVGTNTKTINVYVPDPLTVSPKTLTFTGTGQTKTLTVTQPGTASWSAASSDTAVATVQPGGSSNQFTVTSVGTGTATVTIADAIGNLFKVKVSVP